MSKEEILGIIKTNRWITWWGAPEIVFDDLIITSNRILVIRRKTGSGSVYLRGLDLITGLVETALSASIQAVQKAQSDEMNRLILSSDKIEELLKLNKDNFYIQLSEIESIELKEEPT